MTISAECLEQKKQLHQDPGYGVSSLQYAPLVIQAADQINAKSISDYGAGKCNLQKKMNELGRSNFQYYPYDPAFPEYGDPQAADLVCCIDVLEHIEPDHLEAVLKDLERITLNVGFLTIQTGPAHPAFIVAEQVQLAVDDTPHIGVDITQVAETHLVGAIPAIPGGEGVGGGVEPLAVGVG